ncbi:MAG: hypothetical protein AVDCRST_MAG13-2327, partial [uncultured Solirubrobacteraceae bacterium]
GVGLPRSGLPDPGRSHGPSAPRARPRGPGGRGRRAGVPRRARRPRRRHGSPGRRAGARRGGPRRARAHHRQPARPAL